MFGLKSKLNMTLPHNLPQDEALRRIKTLLGEVKKEYGGRISNLKEQWDWYTGTFSFSVMIFSVSGSLIVRRNEVELSVNLPLAANAKKKEIEKIESTVRKRATSLLA